jgi:hypothetical protein
MGGLFPAGKEANFFRPDPLSTVYSLANWKRPVVFAGWEIGKDVITGGQYLRIIFLIKVLFIVLINSITILPVVPVGTRLQFFCSWKNQNNFLIQ